MTRMLERLDARDVKQIDPHGTLEENLRRVAAQPDEGRPLAHEKEFGVADIVAHAIGEDDPKRLEELLTQSIAKRFGGHRGFP